VRREFSADQTAWRRGRDSSTAISEPGLKRSFGDQTSTLDLTLSDHPDVGAIFLLADP